MHIKNKHQFYLIGRKLVLELLHLGFGVMDDAFGHVDGLHAVLCNRKRALERETQKLKTQAMSQCAARLHLSPPVLLCVLLSILDHVLDVVFAEPS